MKELSTLHSYTTPFQLFILNFTPHIAPSPFVNMENEKLMKKLTNLIAKSHDVMRAMFVSLLTKKNICNLTHKLTVTLTHSNEIHPRIPLPSAIRESKPYRKSANPLKMPEHDQN